MATRPRMRSCAPLAGHPGEIQPLRGHAHEGLGRLGPDAAAAVHQGVHGHGGDARGLPDRLVTRATFAQLADMLTHRRRIEPRAARSRRPSPGPAAPGRRPRSWPSAGLALTLGRPRRCCAART